MSSSGQVVLITHWDTHTNTDTNRYNIGIANSLFKLFTDAVLCICTGLFTKPKLTFNVSRLAIVCTLGKIWKGLSNKYE